MKISRTDSNPTTELNPSKGVASAGAASDSKPQAALSAASDRVQLSNLSRYLASALLGSPARVAKMSELTAAISSGDYQVDAFAVSGSLIQHSIDFGHSGYLALSV